MSFDDILQAQAMCAAAWDGEENGRLLHRALAVAILVGRHDVNASRAVTLVEDGTPDPAEDDLLIAAKKERDRLIHEAKKALKAGRITLKPALESAA
ncbi:hypothetical protein [Nonomuraea sp. NPDC050310]|uniref:hypothetical protein n=1 Tax=Nonomuraea sp. NPDC050310 TaxID=3154935 RepID=UPI0033FA4703